MDVGGRTQAVAGGAVLLDGGEGLVPATVRWSGTRITAVETGTSRQMMTPLEPGPGAARAGGGAARGGAAQVSAGTALDADGCWVLPGLVDVHGDAFERCLMPRPGVAVDTDVALADNDRQLLAAGITTSFLSATDSWEPGLRSRTTLRALVEALDRRRGGPDVRLHVRHERCNTEGLDELIGWMEQGVVRLLSFNDHTPTGADGGSKLSASQVERAGVGRAELEQRMIRAVASRPTGLAQEARLADVARSLGCPLASHDAADTGDLVRDLRLGVGLAEFPLTVELALAYRRQGIAVVLGAPNLARGRSHLGNLSVADAIEADACDVLCSDYHYPSLLQAAIPPFPAASGQRDLARSWHRASAAAAAAAGLPDRGRIAAGCRADLVVVEPPDRHGQRPARVRAVVAGGRLVHLAA